MQFLYENTFRSRNIGWPLCYIFSGVTTPAIPRFWTPRGESRPRERVAADATTTTISDVLSVEDYKFLSRLDALFDMMHAMNVLELQASDKRLRRAAAAHVYPLRQFIFKCCRRGVCDGADFCWAGHKFETSIALTAV